MANTRSLLAAVAICAGLVPGAGAAEKSAAAALAQEFRAPQTVQEIAAADAADREDGGRGNYKRGQRQFKPLFRDYPYETADAA